MAVHKKLSKALRQAARKVRQLGPKSLAALPAPAGAVFVAGTSIGGSIKRSRGGGGTRILSADHGPLKPSPPPSGPRILSPGHGPLKPSPGEGRRPKATELIEAFGGPSAPRDPLTGRTAGKKIVSTVQKIQETSAAVKELSASEDISIEGAAKLLRQTAADLRKARTAVSKRQRENPKESLGATVNFIFESQASLIAGRGRVMDRRIIQLAATEMRLGPVRRNLPTN